MKKVKAVKVPCKYPTYRLGCRCNLDPSLFEFPTTMTCTIANYTEVDSRKDCVHYFWVIKTLAILP